MPRKKATATEREDPIVMHEEHNPMLPGISLPRNYTPYYVLLLIVFAFLLGALTTKVQSLQDKANAQGALAQTANQPTQAPQAQGPAAHVTVANGHFPVLGQDSAKVTIVEFADPRCPYCQQFFNTVLPQLKKDYIDTGKVKLYWRNFDFLGPSSTVAGNAL